MEKKVGEYRSRLKDAKNKKEESISKMLTKFPGRVNGGKEHEIRGVTNLGAKRGPPNGGH